MRKFAAVVSVAFFVFLFTSKAEAIPAWAKKYDIGCSSCHDGSAGKLTPMGADFLRRGHRMADDEVIKDLNKLFSLNTKLRMHDSNATGRNSTFEVHAFSIYTGGMLSSHFSYFTEMYLYENTGKTSGPADSAYHSKLADAYLMYTSRPGNDTYTTVRFGQLSSSQLAIYWNVGPRFSETRPYVVNNSAVSPNAYKPFMRNFGVEVAQTVKNFHGAFGVLNGTGASFTNSLDNNESKDFYASADYVLDNQGSAVGVYGYKGKGLIVPSSGASWENDFHRTGAFGQYVRGRLNLTGVATRGEEQLTSTNARAENLGLLGEVDWKLSEKVTLFSRYDYFDPNRSKTDDQLSGPVFGSNCSLFDAGRMTFEYHKQGKQVPAGQSKPWEYRMEVAFIF